MSGGISVKYIYSACIVTETPDVRILHDPWFSAGAYDGSWFHFPVVKNPIESIGDVDLIYISHIHPDHYDPEFIKQYFSVYGRKPIIIADHEQNHLAAKARVDKLDVTVLREPMLKGNTRITILPHNTGSISDLDSAIILHYSNDHRTHCVVNANDIIFDDGMLRELQQTAGAVDIFLCGYTGAGPYPQTYFRLGSPELASEADKKKQHFFDRYRKTTAAIGARINIPFAGQYVLGGSLTELNKFRGVADATEVLAIDTKAVVLADGGIISTVDGIPTAVRTTAYTATEIDNRLREIANCKMDYQRLFALEEVRQLPIKRLLMQAARKAQEKSECDSDYYFVIRLPDDDVAVINANKSAKTPLVFQKGSAPLPEPRNEIGIDVRYLFGLLTHVYHWNSAGIGSQYYTTRVPNVFNRQAQSFLHYLTV